jgi:hypothetical protein
LRIEKNTLKFEKKSGDKRPLNPLNTLVPNMLLEITGNLGFGGDYLN